MHADDEQVEVLLRQGAHRFVHGAHEAKLAAGENLGQPGVQLGHFGDEDPFVHGCHRCSDRHDSAAAVSRMASKWSERTTYS
jgi:hypothetical protein